MGALDDIMNGKRLVRSAMSQVNQQSANTGNSTSSPSAPELTGKQLQDEQDAKQVPASPLGVKKNAARNELVGTDVSKTANETAQPTQVAGRTISQATKVTPPTLSTEAKPESKWGKVAQKIEAANNADLLQYFKRPKTDAELEEEERKQKRNETFARLADGIGAFHDAYSYARGVKPMERSNMSEKSRQRYEKLRAEWNQDRDSYVNAVLRQQNQRRLEENEASIRRDREERRVLREREIKAREDQNAATQAWREQQRKDKEVHEKNKDEQNAEKNKIAKEKAQAYIDWMRSRGSGKSGSKSSGGTTTRTTTKEDVYDENGRKVGTRTTTTTAKGGAYRKPSTKASSSTSAPPSRRGQNGNNSSSTRNDNTPPSRRK